MGATLHTKATMLTKAHRAGISIITLGVLCPEN